MKSFQSLTLEDSAATLNFAEKRCKTKPVKMGVNSLEFQVSEKSARDELKSSMVSMASTTISYESSDCNNTSIEEMNISYESPAPRVKLNLMEMLKE